MWDSPVSHPAAGKQNPGSLVWHLGQQLPDLLQWLNELSLLLALFLIQQQQ